MKSYVLLIILLSIFCSLIYLSSVYLVKAEHSVKQLEQDTEQLEKDLPLDETGKLPDTPAGIPLTPEANQLAREKPVTPGNPPLISMEFENANMKDVLKIFCQQSGLNFIAGENIQLKPVTLYLNNVTVDDALNTIVKANGLIYNRAEGSNVFIVTKSAEPEIKLETRIFKLKYAFAEDKTITGIDTASQTVKGIKETIQKLLSPNGDLSVDTRTNSLIITDITSSFKVIEKALRDLDSQLPQILIEAKIVELSTEDLDQLGIKWSSLAAYKFGYKSPIRTYESTRTGGRDRTDVYTTEREDTSEIEDEIVSKPLEGTGSETITATATSGASTGRLLTDTFTKALANSDIRSAILSADDFTLTLSLLLTDTNVDLISSPNIVTTHGKEAKITVGEKYPIPNYTYNTETSTWEVQGFEYRDIGILLRVIPYAAKEENNISLEIHPEVSSISNYVNFGGSGGAKIPIIATREAITNVVIKDGDTLAIGGMLTDRDNTVITKVPVLGDIPVLGNLFKHRETTKTKLNMIIFITPHILKNSNLPMDIAQEVTVPVPVAPKLPAPALEEPKVSEEQESSGIKEAYQFKHR